MITQPRIRTALRLSLSCLGGLVVVGVVGFTLPLLWVYSLVGNCPQRASQTCERSLLIAETFNKVGLLAFELAGVFLVISVILLAMRRPQKA